MIKPLYTLSLLAGLLLAGASMVSAAPATKGVPCASWGAGHISLQDSGVAATDGEMSISFAEFDEIALWRHGQSQDGRAALRQLLELRLLRQLMAEHGLEISAAQLDKKRRELDAETRKGGGTTGLAGQLSQAGIPEALFQRYLELSMAQEILARRALGISEDGPITSEQQSSWLESVILERSYSEEEYPWNGGAVARCGDITIGKREYLAHLREQLRNKDIKRLCFDLLLEKKLRARMPDLSDAALLREVDNVVAERRKKKESDPRYKGVPYEDLLKAKGLSLEGIRKDPAIHSAALAQLWVDRGLRQDLAGEAGVQRDRLKSTYNKERDYFDGRFGESVEIYAVVLKAAVHKNDLNKRTFNEADMQLDRLGKSLQRVGNTKRVRLDDFQALVKQHSEEKRSREVGGSLGDVRQLSRTVPEQIIRVAFELLRSDSGDLSGRLLGPVQVQGASVLICLGKRTPAPLWSEMAAHVHKELRRRFFSETLLPADVTTWVDLSENER